MFDFTRVAMLVVLNSDVVVGPEWLERLTAAACSSNSSLPRRRSPTSEPSYPFPAATSPTLGSRETFTPMSPRSSSQRRRCSSGLTIILTAVGALASTSSALPWKRSATSTRASFGVTARRSTSPSGVTSRLGFRHVCADDVFTYHRGNASSERRRSPSSSLNEELVNIALSRYRHAVTAARRLDGRPVAPRAHAASCARWMALIGRRIGVDATCLGNNLDGHAGGRNAPRRCSSREVALHPNSPLLRVFVRPSFATGRDRCLRRAFRTSSSSDVRSTAFVATTEPSSTSSTGCSKSGLARRSRSSCGVMAIGWS